MLAIRGGAPPVIPATWEAEARESLEAGGRVAVSWDGTIALHPGWQKQNCLKKKKKSKPFQNFEKVYSEINAHV